MRPPSPSTFRRTSKSEGAAKPVDCSRSIVIVNCAGHSGPALWSSSHVQYLTENDTIVKMKNKAHTGASLIMSERSEASPRFGTPKYRILTTCILDEM